MEIIFVDGLDLKNISQGNEPEFRFRIDKEKEHAAARYVRLLKRGYHGLASFSTEGEEETFLKEISLATDIGISLEWIAFLNAYLLAIDTTAKHSKIYFKVEGHYHALYDNGAEHDYNKFKKWIKWLPKGYYHLTSLAGSPLPESIGRGLEKLADALNIKIEWKIKDNQLFYWRKGETCAKKQLLGGTCNGCTEEIRDVCRLTNRHAH